MLVGLAADLLLFAALAWAWAGFRHPLGPASGWAQALVRAWGPTATVYAVLVAALAPFARTETQRLATVRVVPGLPAFTAGLRDGDHVMKVDGAPVDDFDQVVARVTEARGPVRVLVDRDEERFEVTLERPLGGKLGLSPVLREWPVGPTRWLERSALAPLALLELVWAEVLSGPHAEAKAPKGLVPTPGWLTLVVLPLAAGWPGLVLLSAALGVRQGLRARVSSSARA